MMKHLLFPFLAIASILPAFAAVEHGEAAPEFTLADSKGTSHKLSDFRGSSSFSNGSTTNAPS